MDRIDSSELYAVYHEPFLDFLVAMRMTPFTIRNDDDRSDQNYTPDRAWKCLCATPADRGLCLNLIDISSGYYIVFFDYIFIHSLFISACIFSDILPRHKIYHKWTPVCTLWNVISCKNTEDSLKAIGSLQRFFTCFITIRSDYNEQLGNLRRVE